MLWTVTEVQRVIKTLYISNVKHVDIKEETLFFTLFMSNDMSGNLDSTVQNNTKKRNAKAIISLRKITMVLLQIKPKTTVTTILP